MVQGFEARPASRSGQDQIGSLASSPPGPVHYHATKRKFRHSHERPIPLKDFRHVSGEGFRLKGFLYAPEIGCESRPPVTVGKEK